MIKEVGDSLSAKCDSQPLIDLFELVLPISDEIKSIIRRDTFRVTFKKGKYIISPIDRNKNLFYIVKGVVRGYVKDDEKEVTTWISKEGDIVGTIKNLWQVGDSDEYLQALEDVELICIPHSMSEYLYANYMEANFVGRVLAEQYYQAAQERAFLTRISSAEKRYKRFLQNCPGLEDRIALKYIASFLGIRLETLSRIRSQLQ